MNKSATLFAATVLATFALAMAVTPTASAHDCYELLPGALSCGQCLNNNHEGSRRFGIPTLTWCSSSPCDTAAAFMQRDDAELGLGLVC